MNYNLTYSEVSHAKTERKRKIALHYFSLRFFFFHKRSIHLCITISMKIHLINVVMLQQLIMSQVIKVQIRLASTREMVSDISESRSREKKQNIEAKTWRKLSVSCHHQTTDLAAI